MNWKKFRRGLDEFNRLLWAFIFINGLQLFVKDPGWTSFGVFASGTCLVLVLIALKVGLEE